jgi:hypothetical protein
MLAEPHRDTTASAAFSAAAQAIDACSVESGPGLAFDTLSADED